MLILLAIFTTSHFKVVYVKIQISLSMLYLWNDVSSFYPASS